MQISMVFRSRVWGCVWVLLVAAGCGFGPGYDNPVYFPCIGATICPYGQCECLDGAICVPQDSRQSPSACYPPDACLLDSECDDEDDCSLDSCVDFFCEHEPVDDPVSCLSGFEVLPPGLPAHRVYPGQMDLLVHVRVANLGTQTHLITDCSLGFFRQDQDLEVEYTQEAKGVYPVPVAPGSSHSLLLSVSLSDQATTGSVEIRARVPVEGMNLVESNESAFWFVAGGHSPLWVTTVDDEDDTGETADVVSAGGLEDISLREALLIANASEDPVVLRFHPEIFPSELPTSIHIAPALGPLPAINRAGAWLDGSGVSVYIDGSGLQGGSGLVIRAQDVGIKAVNFSNFTGSDLSTCIRSVQVDGVQVIDCSLEACGSPHNRAPNLLLQGGLNHVVSGSRMASSLGGGFSLAGSPVGVTIRNNVVVSNTSFGLTVTGRQHRIEDNHIDTNAGNNLERVSVQDVRVARTRLSNSREFHGLFASGGSTKVSVSNCELQGNRRSGIHVETGSRGVSIARCSFAHNGVPVVLEPGANDDVSPPTLVYFDGLTVTGTAPMEAQSVEIYAGSESLSFVGEAAVATGQWMLKLADSVLEIRAFATTREGSTSAFSKILQVENDLVVSTAEDELDGGPDIILVDQAGGAEDLSLREAMVIANNREGPDHIRFDPAVFPPDGNTVIRVGAGGMQGLPALTDPGTVLQGEDSGPVLDGQDLTEANSAIIRIEADACSVEGLTLQNVDAPNASCIHLHSGTGARVAECILFGCGTTGSGAGIFADERAKGASLVGNEITGGRASIFCSFASNLLMADNQLSFSTSSCIETHFGGGHVIRDNNIHDCGLSGVRVSKGSSGIVVVGNRLWNNAGTAVALSEVAVAEVVYNSMVLNKNGLSFANNHTNTLGVQNNLVALNAEYGLIVVGTVTLQEDHNLFFDNGEDGVSGAKAFSGLGDHQPDASDVLADPLLVDPSAGDFTPRAAAIDAGIDTGEDRNSDAPGRFNGTAPDIGAIETD